MGYKKQYYELAKRYNEMIDECNRLHEDNGKLLKKLDAMSQRIGQLTKALGQATEDKKRMADEISELNETLIDCAARTDRVLLRWGWVTDADEKMVKGE